MRLNKRTIKPWLRAAAIINQQYRPAPNYSTSAFPITESTDLIETLIRLENQINLAARQGWSGAHEQIKRNYRAQLRHLRERIDQSAKPLEVSLPFVLREAEIVRELLAIQTEFSDVAVCLESKTLTASTEPIVLDDKQLGAFQICLELATLNTEHPAHYQVIAATPHPAASADETTHPHVRNNQLCEGDAQPAIHQALRQGRLFDFFQLVNNVLHTYNPSSPYVALADWEDRSCGDCGQLTNRDDCDCCSVCESCVCDSCWYTCHDCDQHHCGGCTHVCHGCLADVCQSCVNSCPNCYEKFCADCLQPNQERCHHCETPKTENVPESETEGPAAAVHADGLGQAAVSA